MVWTTSSISAVAFHKQRHLHPCQAPSYPSRKSSRDWQFPGVKLKLEVRPECNKGADPSRKAAPLPNAAGPRLSLSVFQDPGSCLGMPWTWGYGGGGQGGGALGTPSTWSAHTHIPGPFPHTHMGAIPVTSLCTHIPVLKAPKPASHQSFTPQGRLHLPQLCSCPPSTHMPIPSPAP